MNAHKMPIENILKMRFRKCESSAYFQNHLLCVCNAHSQKHISKDALLCTLLNMNVMYIP